MSIVHYPACKHTYCWPSGLKVRHCIICQEFLVQSDDGEPMLFNTIPHSWDYVRHLVASGHISDFPGEIDRRVKNG